MQSTLLETLKKTLTDDESKLVPTAKLIDDLGADSLSAYEIVMDLEDKLNITIEDSDVEKIVTIQDIINIIEKKL